MRLLITGGAGFIGSTLATLAVEDGHDVTVLDDLSTGHRDNLRDLTVRLVEGSVVDRAAVDDAMTDIDSVVHLAALGSVPRSIADPVATHVANATGTLTVLEAARAAGIRHLAYSSSSSVYGLNPALPKHEREWVRPLSPYAVTKLASEQYVLAYQQSFGLSTLAFRLFNVYGPRQRPGHAYAAVVPVFLDRLLRGEPLRVNGDGLHSRDFTYVGAVCRVLLDAARRRVTHPEPVNLAFGTSTTLLELVASLERAAGIVATVEHVDPRPGDVLHSQADDASLLRLFPGIRATPLDEGLAETVAYVKEHL
ncbi:NAD-dependent epimerase/dehydratase family protein [Terracoccus luteus]|uniref:UDP-glucose 4-epimerase n=1 Tax=Terracoccus luteus TaxID=53356 RepID=A0A839PZD5_9MICO|nr:NAD-dependent epimerase/dehydratase family protein [Terracoccus luteus]MBB2987366.1 UDP-glucose 4-epimerase [Terracoccus luteus]MCP2173017.1 UDP-glucose 4-epimerase [Terracoccus luteus]